MVLNLWGLNSNQAALPVWGQPEHPWRSQQLISSFLLHPSTWENAGLTLWFGKRAGEEPLGLYVRTVTHKWPKIIGAGGGGALLVGAGGGTSHSQWQESTVRARRRRRNSLQQHQWAFLGGTPPPLFLSPLPSSPSAIFASLQTRSRGSEPQPGHEQCCLSNDETPRAAARVCAAQPQPRHRIPAFPTSSPNRAETGPPHASPPPKYVKKMSFPLPEPEPG